MDAVKFEDLNITVKTIVVNGKKINKSFLQQIPKEISIVHTRHDMKFIGCGDNDDYIINGSFVCWFDLPVSKSFSPYLVAEEWKGIKGLPSKKSVFNDGHLYFALFINTDLQLRMTVIDKKTISKFNLEQVYI